MGIITFFSAMESDGTEPYGLQKLMECSEVVVRKETSMFTFKYVVTTDEGALFKSLKGYKSKYAMVGGDNKMVMDLEFKIRWLESTYVLVHTACSLPLKIVNKGGFSSSVLILDENDQTRLKIRKPKFGVKFKVFGAEGIEIGELKRCISKWKLSFPLDLEVRYKAALIATCMYLNYLEAAAS